MRKTVCGALAAIVAGISLPQITLAAQGDELIMVDCLLPGQLRHLGRNQTYLSPPRPARRSGRECEIRGGEYVAFDRADLGSALKVWMPQAEAGDLKAIEYVGEIFEKGVGGSANYEAAALWYRKAAELGSTRAQINLGHLYEKGLGVPRDPLEAAKWYRKAAGIEGEIVLDSGTKSAADDAAASKIADLQAQIDRLAPELRVARENLRLSQQSLETYKEQLQQDTDLSAQRNAQITERTAELDRKQVELAATEQSFVNREQELARQKAELQELAATTDDASASKNAELQAQIDRLAPELRVARENLRLSQQSLETYKEQLQQDTELGEQRNAEITKRIAELDQKQVELAATEQSFVKREQDLARQKAELQALAATAAPEADDIALRERAIAGPVISMIDPQLSNVRGAVVVTMTERIERRRIVGRVDAPAGLIQLSINDANVLVNAAGVFQHEVKLRENSTPVHIVATDNQGKTAEYDFSLDRGDEKNISETVAATKVSYDSVNFGNYYALIIGNNKYEHYKDLSTAINDAQRVDGVLKERYGFRTKLLSDATRYEILSAFNDYREKMSPEDNLLIYYAGHGELDTVNERGHWIPVDGEQGNTANWISNITITDILNTMRARHVLLVVDSCYAGAMTRSATSRLKTGMTKQEEVHWLKAMMQKRARMALTSGGLAPVLDVGGGDHSVFAKSFIEVLETNSNVLDGQQLYRDVAARVAYAAANLRFQQEPEYAPIRFAGHEAGDFFLVPTENSSASLTSHDNDQNHPDRIDSRSLRTASIH